MGAVVTEGENQARSVSYYGEIVARAAAGPRVPAVAAE